MKLVVIRFLGCKFTFTSKNLLAGLLYQKVNMEKAQIIVLMAEVFVKQVQGIIGECPLFRK